MGGLCRAGFVIEDLREPYRADANAPPGHFGYRGRFIPPYVRLKARRVARELCRASGAAGMGFQAGWRSSQLLRVNRTTARPPCVWSTFIM